MKAPLLEHPISSVDVLKRGSISIFLLCLSNGPFSLWLRSKTDDDRHAIDIPDNDLVAKLSIPVVYYVAGWTLQQTYVVLLVGDEKCYKYHVFSVGHKLTQQNTKRR